jgi:hypothetical protein
MVSSPEDKTRILAGYKVSSVIRMSIASELARKDIHESGHSSCASVATMRWSSNMSLSHMQATHAMVLPARLLIGRIYCTMEWHNQEIPLGCRLQLNHHREESLKLILLREERESVCEGTIVECQPDLNSMMRRRGSANRLTEHFRFVAPPKFPATFRPHVIHVRAIISCVFINPRPST